MLYFQKADEQGNVLTKDGKQVLADYQACMQKVEMCRKRCQLWQHVILLVFYVCAAIVISRIPLPQRLDLLAGAILCVSVAGVMILVWGIRPYEVRKVSQAHKEAKECVQSLRSRYPDLVEEFYRAREVGLKLPPEIRDAWYQMDQAG